MADTGQRVGDYEVLAPLGAGGMGRVYKVRNVISNREEAMKILLPDFASDPDLAARFMAEIRTLAGLEHPGIAQLRTAFQHNNQFVMVMEYVEGTTLEKLAAQTRIPVDQILDYSTQVLAALSYAHGRGRDPSRHQAGQHHDHHPRPGQADGFRHRRSPPTTCSSRVPAPPWARSTTCLRSRCAAARWTRARTSIRLA